MKKRTAARESGDGPGDAGSDPGRPYDVAVLDQLSPGDVLRHCIGQMGAAMVAGGKQGLLDAVSDPLSVEGMNELYFDTLGELAVVDGAAARRLHNIAWLSVNALCRACCRSPELFRPVAREEYSWPALVGPHADLGRASEDLARLIELGAEVSLGVRGKWSVQTAETRITFQLWQYLENFRRNSEHSWFPPVPFEDELIAACKTLPALSRDTYKEWWKLSERVFLHISGPDFENDERFRDYWPPRGGKSAVYRGVKDPRAMIRRDIKAKIKQAFRSVARRAGAV